MTPPEIILWVFALLFIGVGIASIIVIEYITFKVLCAIKEKGLHY